MIKHASYLFLSVFFVLGCSEDPPGPPLAPVGLTATAISNTEIQLSWTDVSNDEHGFIIQRLSGPDSLSGFGPFVGLMQVSVNASGYTDRSLTPGTNYYYQVASFNSTGSNYSNVATAKTLDQSTPLQVITEINSIGMASALGVVTFIGDPYPEVSDCGLIWSTSTSPTTDLETKTPNLLGVGNSFISAIGVLEPSKKYYVRAYAKNAQGTVYGNEVSFTTSNTPFFVPGSGVVDVEGNSYKTIVIGDQEWMAENLRTSTFANGESIANVTDAEQWGQLTSPAWCHYDNNSQYDNIQGKLYNWYAASNARNVCPNGWHLPKLSEWEQLSDYLGGGFISGVRLKSPLSTWQVQPDISTNESGFSAVHSGWCHPCYNQYAVATWWTSTQRMSDNALVYNVGGGSVGPWIFDMPFAVAVCVRCIKN